MLKQLEFLKKYVVNDNGTNITIHFPMSTPDQFDEIRELYEFIKNHEQYYVISNHADDKWIFGTTHKKLQRLEYDLQNYTLQKYTLQSFTNDEINHFFDYQKCNSEVDIKRRNAEKKKCLTQLYIVMEKITKDAPSLRGDSIVTETTTLMNNLEIRHNLTIDSVKDFINILSDVDFEKLLDYIYNNMIIICLKHRNLNTKDIVETIKSKMKSK